MSGWSEKIIQNVLCGLKGFVPYTRYICIPNVNSGFAVFTGESDLIAVSDSGYLKEIEVKISVGDLKRDKAKVKHRFWELEHNPISELWYAMPRYVADKIDVTAHIPDYAGIITIHSNSTKYFHQIVRKAKRKHNARKLTDREMLKIARLGCIRLWTQKLTPPVSAAERGGK